jgi:hypothetical protein
MVGAPESLYVQFENRENVALGNICHDSQVFKKKISIDCSVLKPAAGW